MVKNEFDIIELYQTKEVEFDGWDDEVESEAVEVERKHIPMLFEKFLIAVNIVIFFIIASIDDFEFQALWIIMFMVMVFVINCWIIKNFGQIFNE